MSETTTTTNTTTEENAMTVRQLIDALSRMPQNELVVLEDNGGDVEVVEVDESTGRVVLGA